MKTYEESLEAVLNFIRAECGDYKTTCRWASFTALSISYEKDRTEIYEDAQKINDRFDDQLRLENLRERRERQEKLRKEKDDK